PNDLLHETLRRAANLGAGVVHTLRQTEAEVLTDLPGDTRRRADLGGTPHRGSSRVRQAASSSLNSAGLAVQTIGQRLTHVGTGLAELRNRRLQSRDHPTDSRIDLANRPVHSGLDRVGHLLHTIGYSIDALLYSVGDGLPDPIHTLGDRIGHPLDRFGGP